MQHPHRALAGYDDRQVHNGQLYGDAQPLSERLEFRPLIHFASL